MIKASDIISGVYRKLGRPSQNDMPYQDLLDIVRDVIRERTIDLKMSVRGHTNELGSWATPTDREMPSGAFTGGIDNFIPVKVEWRYLSQSNLIPAYKAEVVAYEQLDGLWRKSIGIEDTYVAFYDNMSKIAFSETLTLLSQREYRVILENLEDVKSPDLTTSFSTLPSLFVTLCMDDVSMRALDYVDTPTDVWTEKRERLRPNLAMSLANNEHRFKEWRKSLYGNKLVTKVGFRPRR